jgi:hypothetical protein
MFAALIPLLGGLLDRLIPDPAQAAAAKLQLMTLVQNGELAQMTAATGVITAEANSKFALTAMWRPILMMVFTAIIANNYILAPYLHAMFGWAVTLDLPPQMWDLLKLGIGGYVVGRSAEKAVTTYVQAKNPPAPASSGLPAFNTNGA